MEENMIEQIIRESSSFLELPERCYSYMAGMIIDDPPSSPEDLESLLLDFFTDGEKQVELANIMNALWQKLLNAGVKPSNKLERITAQQIKHSLVLKEIGINAESLTADYIDPFLGIQRATVNYNPTDKGRMAKERAKKTSEEAKDLPKLRKEIPQPVKVHERGEGKNMDIIIDRFSLMVGGKVLLDGASLKLSFGRKYGFIGRNGIGKTSLLISLVLGEIEKVPSHINIVYVEQEVRTDNFPVLQAVLATDVERTKLLQEQQEFADDAEKVAELHERLLQIDGYAAESKAATILSGLGFTPEMMQLSSSQLSGGWRMRVSLAKALFCEPDILLLDEPTNHLDLETVIWLENYLNSYKQTVLIVSHDRDFLNNVTQSTIHFKDQKLQYYKGNYDQFEKTMREQQQLQKRQFEAQQSKIEHIQKFIDKFRYNAKRASMVQSRIKTLKKMEKYEDVIEDPTCVFIFPQADKLAAPLLRIDDGVFSYGDNRILENINLNIDMSTRMAILGRNGCGKTTLLKILTEELELCDGHLYRHRRLRIGTFNQHHIDQLELSFSALEQLASAYPAAPHEDLRTHLGSFGISGNLALRPMIFLSGGQKSRVAFALVAFSNPHILLLDEPTNHLDIDAVSGLIIALNVYNGGILVVSHDQFFVSAVCEELFVIKKGRVRKFKGEFSDYRKQLSS